MKAGCGVDVLLIPLLEGTPGILALQITIRRDAEETILCINSGVDTVDGNPWCEAGMKTV